MTTPTNEVFCKKLGLTGVLIPEVGLGTWNYTGGVEPLQRGVAAGAAFIDTAESYEAEPAVGEAIQGVRDRVFLATKVSPEHFRAADVIRAADESLRRLRTDHIDLYQLHKPNDQIPLAETLGAMEELVDAGKVRWIGVSNFNLPELQRAQQTLRKHPLVANQVRFNLVDRTIEADLLPYCEAQGITVIAYSPLAREMSRIFDGDARGTLTEIARAVGKTRAQVALNWCLCRPPVVVIPKGSSVAHVLDNCGASGWRLTPEQVARLDQEIQFRRRGRLDAFLRSALPPALRQVGVSVLRRLPRGWRKRLS